MLAFASLFKLRTNNVVLEYFSTSSLNDYISAIVKATRVTQNTATLLTRFGLIKSMMLMMLVLDREPRRFIHANSGKRFDASNMFID